MIGPNFADVALPIAPAESEEDIPEITRAIESIRLEELLRWARIEIMRRGLIEGWKI